MKNPNTVDACILLRVKIPSSPKTQDIQNKYTKNVTTSALGYGTSSKNPHPNGGTKASFPNLEKVIAL